MYSYLLEELSKAIGARLLIKFNYNNKSYTVEPHLIGKNNNNEDCLCAWEINHQEEQWRCFMLKDIRNLAILEEHFFKQRPGYDPYDSSMSRIYYRI
ncbi:WYL domain-containing protein [Pontibacter sp. SGAir0037]|uniref:WYL domain-containing protein n=1 Tax=Pontibacter sp. SGAir0037 TaxID=2571030 RepID=UPI0010CCE2D1|nr:WYL domain-containing protein [Pontibacter sp. SGAir0037]QCR23846.1 hypothetical protein C1N53_16820 [Pontibacter sp. SGAir0037]